MPKPVRVLVVGLTATIGGIENFLMAYCGAIDPRRVQFDFLTRFEDAAYPDLRDKIGKTYVIPCRSKQPLAFYRRITAFFREHAREYDVLWDNECMFNDMTPLMLAKKYGIPVRIAHCHNPQNMDVSAKGRLQELLHRAQRRALGRYANVLWACSGPSAQWACPRLDIPYELVPNAIRAASFRPQPGVRQRMRAALSLEGCLVVGHVGRLQYQKNQPFLLEAFAALHRQEPRARLVLAGDGPDMTTLEAQAVRLGIAGEVLFLGVREDIPHLMQCFDLFALPSRFEGLGMAAIEAQAADVPCLVSDAVPREAALTERVTFLPAKDPAEWANAMAELLHRYEDAPRRDRTEDIASAGYDLPAAAQCLTERFEQLAANGAGVGRRFLLTVDAREPGLPAMAKARADVAEWAAQAGYTPVAFSTPDSARRDMVKRLKMLISVPMDWQRLGKKLRRGDILLVQYPYFPVKGAPVARRALRRLRRKGVHTAALVHDLDSLRRVGGRAAVWSDRNLLPVFERVIAHNDRMARYLTLQGIPAERLTTLGLFDYRTDAPMPERTLQNAVCVAGNLSRAKSGWLYHLPRSGVRFHLYGAGWVGKKRTTLVPHGPMAADELPGALEGAFGLVWDGDSCDICRGEYGAYLMINNPHKLSLYLAAGMPVLVWSQSAQAAFVRREGVGLTLDSLNELDAVMRSVTPASYAAMAESARHVGEQLRRGENTLRVLREIECG